MYMVYIYYINVETRLKSVTHKHVPKLIQERESLKKAQQDKIENVAGSV
jgi:hypothetical protein